MNHPRTLSIRRWLALALISLFIVPILSMVVIGFFVFADGGGPSEADDEVIAALTASPERWDDPSWQQTLMDDRIGDSVDVVLMRDDEVVFQSTGNPLADDGTRQVQHVTVDDTDPALTALVYSDPSQGPPEELQQWFVPVIQGVVILLTLAGIAWFLRRSIVDPLTAASDAAHRIAGGELNISLPRSRVREVDQLGRSFEEMSTDLRQSLDLQAKLEHERRQFISAIAHDLRTPLFTLRGSLEGLQTGVAKTPEQQDRYLGIAQARADQLERLITDLFSFTRLEYLEEQPQRSDVDIVTLARDVMASARPRAGARKLNMIDTTDASPAPIQADRHMLTRALDNLIDNALRHTPEGGEIRLEIHERDNAVVMELTDSGPGFAGTDLPHLFEPLYRGEVSRNRETGGAGLGLTIAQRIVAAHGGTLVAGNAPGGGARLTVTLSKGA